jgi:hypothetical protein
MEILRGMVLARRPGRDRPFAKLRRITTGPARPAFCPRALMNLIGCVFHGRRLRQQD